MVEVFKTNVNEEIIADVILKILVLSLPESYINFDLEDCDRILRIENCKIHTSEVIQILKQYGYERLLLE